MLTTEELHEYVHAFQSRMENSEECAHSIFPEVCDDASLELADVLTAQLAMMIAVGMSPGDVEEAAVHAFHVAIAFGYGLGALSTADLSAGMTDALSSLTPDADPATVEWEATIRQASDADWGPDWL